MSIEQETIDPVQDELATLKARADLIGVTYHPSVGVAKLREKIAAHLAGEKPAEEAKPAAPVEESAALKRKRLKNHANELVRIRLTCMNPAKKDWDGEIITVGNALVGTVSKYVPFNVDAWHVPRIMLDMLRARECQTFSTERTHRGVAVRRSKLIREFAIELLDPLTPDELHDLAQRQAMAKSID